MIYTCKCEECGNISRGSKMTENKINFLMYVLIAIGLILVIIGLGLIFFTDIYIKNGTEGVFLIAGIIGAGLFLLLPAKIYLTLQLMKNNDKKLKSSINK